MSDALALGESVKLSFCQMEVMGRLDILEASVEVVVLERRETVRDES